MTTSAALAAGSGPADGRDALRAALFLVLTGICAALHIWKLPPALLQLQADFHLGLVASGFLLSIVQLGGMLLGLPVGLLAERIGLRRCIVYGLGILSVASAAGAAFGSGLAVLVGRAVEGVGFLMVVMPIPALIRRLVTPARLPRIMGWWGCYMPTGTVIILLVGSWILNFSHWQALWLLLAVVTAGCQVLVVRLVPAVAPPPAAGRPSTLALVRITLHSPDTWLVALTFGAYAGQWVAIVGFLPSIYAAQGISGMQAGLMTAIVAGSNAIGNLAAGRLLHRGVAAWLLLVIGLVAMIVCAYAAFGAGLPASLQFLSITAFSLVGGLVPATLFVLALTLTPTPQTASTTVGWMQQCSSFGQFIGAPFVAWVVGLAGGNWQWSWVATGLFSVLGILLALAIRQRTR